jgi:DNA polymerase III epsilon subunit-like protein
VSKEGREGRRVTKPSLYDRQLAFLDTETTGLEPTIHEVLELGLVIDPPPRLGGRHRRPPTSTYVQWQTRILPQQLSVAEPRALAINGYAEHPERWEGAPKLAEIAEELLRMLEHKVIVGQNPDFDVRFLRSGLLRAGIDPERVRACLNRHTVNVANLAFEHLVPLGLNRVNLDAICTFLGVSNEGAHRALTDCFRVRCCFYALDRPDWLTRRAWRHRARKLLKTGLMP